MNKLGFIGIIVKNKDKYCFMATDYSSDRVVYYKIKEEDLESVISTEMAKTLKLLRVGEQVECLFTPQFLSTPLTEQDKDGKVVFENKCLTAQELSERESVLEIELTIGEIFKRAEKQWDTTETLEACGLNPWCLNEGADPKDMTSITRKQAKRLGISDHEFNLRGS